MGSMFQHIMQRLAILAIALVTLCGPAFSVEPAVTSVIESVPVHAPADAAQTDAALAKTLTAQFQQDFAQAVAAAKTYLGAQRSRKAAVALDLDETVLDNRAYYAIHKTFAPPLWDAWVAQVDAPGLPASVELVHWLNRKGFKVFFISGRREYQRQQTVDNLRKIGITRYAGLYLKPNDYDKSTASDFKVDAQTDIQRRGYRVLAIIGDQASDLRGSPGKGFKLPNPLYTIP